jgi:predicted Zn-dependent peptidase
MVAPLRYLGPDPVAASLDAPFRTSAPEVGAEAPLPRPELSTFRLRNGLSVVLLERHSFPTIVTRLAVDLADVDERDVGGLEAGLLGSVLLAPRHAFGASASCGTSCILAAWGPSDAGEAIFARLNGMLTQAPEPRVEVERSLAAAQAGMRTQWGFAEGASRAEASLLFGHTHRYGYAPMTRTLTVDDLLRMRALAMDPRKATLFVVGDISGDETLRLATAHLDSWTAGAYVAPAPPAPPPAPQGPRLVFISDPRVKQVYGAVFVRGPAPGDTDESAFFVLGELLGGSPASAAFEHVRGDLGAAYQVGASFRWYRDASVLRLGGTFVPGHAAQGLVGLLDTIRAVRDAEPSAEALSRAKRAAVAGWRRSLGTNEGLAMHFAGATLLGRAPESTFDQADRIQAVTGIQVREAARKYLAADVVRVVVIGAVANMGDLRTLHLGDAVQLDAQARLVKTTEAK